MSKKSWKSQHWLLHLHLILFTVFQLKLSSQFFLFRSEMLLNFELNRTQVDLFPQTIPYPRDRGFFSFNWRQALTNFEISWNLLKAMNGLKIPNDFFIIIWWCLWSTFSEVPPSTNSINDVWFNIVTGLWRRSVAPPPLGRTWTVGNPGIDITECNGPWNF